MALPIIETPTYELTLPSQETKVKFRPFLVKEEKMMLIALESGEEKQIQEATKQVLGACTFNKIDILNLPTFDIEYMFLQIRAKSVGEISKFQVICPDDKKTYTDIEIDISKIEVQVDDGHTNKVVFDDTRQLGVVLKYPTMAMINSKTLKDADYDTVFDLMLGCVHEVFEGDKVYPGVDTTKEELKEFFEKMPQGTFDKIRKFFDTMPRLRHTQEVTNPKTGVKSKVTFEGLNDFFGLASPIVA
jgi:hypothetical protein|tara:strand:+ start:176 stop:910 length:735 start_codon:yes stop_codon:yes gene_type:complete